MLLVLNVFSLTSHHDLGPYSASIVRNLFAAYGVNPYSETNSLGTLVDFPELRLWTVFE